MENWNSWWNGCVEAWLIGMSLSLVLGPVWILLFFFALWLVGFTIVGVAGGSIAAVTQSGMGLVPAGSMFACLQSTAASGVFALHPLVYLFSSLQTTMIFILIMVYSGSHIASDCSCSS